MERSIYAAVCNVLTVNGKGSKTNKKNLPSGDVFRNKTAPTKTV